MEIEDELERAKNVWQQISYVENVDDPDETDEAYKEFKRSETATMGVHVSGAACGYGWGPQAQWSRDVAAGYRWLAKGTEDRNVLPWPKRGNKRVFGSIWNDRIEADFNRRAELRLKLMGRQGFADWQINRQTTYPPQFNTSNPKIVDANGKQVRPDYWDGKSPIVAKILAVDGKLVRQRAGNAAWYALHYPRLRKDSAPSLVPDETIVNAADLMEGIIDEPAPTKNATSERVRGPRPKVAIARGGD
jgi:hypothetical protein